MKERPEKIQKILDWFESKNPAWKLYSYRDDIDLLKMFLPGGCGEIQYSQSDIRKSIETDLSLEIQDVLIIDDDGVSRMYIKFPH